MQTTGQHNWMRIENEHTKSLHEKRIRQLEEQEAKMISQMQQTLARKDKAYETLKEKSIALKKNIEPRGAYKISGGHHGSQTSL